MSAAHPGRRAVNGAQLAYPLVATFLLRGDRSAERFWLELDDVSFDRSIVMAGETPGPD
jgi:hypothetical protein